jgi:hypothetical protein
MKIFGLKLFRIPVGQGEDVADILLKPTVKRPDEGALPLLLSVWTSDHFNKINGEL